MGHKHPAIVASVTAMAEQQLGLVTHPFAAILRRHLIPVVLSVCLLQRAPAYSLDIPMDMDSMIRDCMY